MIVFITGGVRSGKSSFAEQLATDAARRISRNLHYIATSQKTDQEMEERIKRHQEKREHSPFAWRTWEVPVCLEGIADYFQSGDLLLLDCLTNLATNELFAGWENGTEKWQNGNYRSEVYHRIIQVIEQLDQRGVTLFIVSNEIFQSPIPDDPGTLYFAELLGKLHQHIVAMAARAYLVENGIATVKKGEHHEGER
ncbi:bifunctional adenosylcobinamide kinase/adenosylcobinamide-phosphate guanylyltransferase [Fictibacillus sp. Mic-4]|uniref:bifunctional adenosylcobinamide kinase/adenosylcobinamide-phosphate guanylyltransferase n=1 Tax=Fictibacillus sp. Mic-4 TaxID=3132826 RepID=UPI003CF74477